MLALSAMLRADVMPHSSTAEAKHHSGSRNMRLLSQVLAQLPQASTRQSSAILSSIEFDRDAQFFATAGVSKRISIYDFASVLANPYSDVHCPALELGTRSKLSCLSWHRYIKSNLISSDYEGAHRACSP